MTAQLAPIPIQKFFDNNGNPLFNGKLYSYVAGTSTPQATYTDSTMGTQNTNPVILNARGEANVWLDTTLSYKLVLQEANGTQIWAVDNIPGNGVFGTVQNIAALRNVTGVGVSNYQAIIVDGYTTAGDGGGGTFWWNSISTVADNGGTIIAPTGVGTGRWYRLTNQVFVNHFGAIGDGVTNNDTAITNANNWLVANPNNDLYWAPGTYVTSISPNWAISGSRLIGLGTVTIKYSGTGNCLTFDAGSSASATIYNCYADNFILDGGSTGTVGLYTRGIAHSYFKVRVKNLNSTSGIAFNAIDCVLNTYQSPTASINEFSLTSIPYYGIYLDARVGGGGCSANQFLDCTIEGMNTGIYANECARGIFTGTCEDCVTGINEQSNCVENIFIAFDLESNSTVDWVSGARNSSMINCTTGKLVHFTSAAFKCEFSNGNFAALTIDSGAIGILVSNSYGTVTGNLTDNGTDTQIINTFNTATGTLVAKIPLGVSSPYINVTGATPSVSSGVAIGASTTSTATSGSASLPTNPSGFLIVNINGTNFKIPLYNN